MNAKEMDLLERAFAAEVESALTKKDFMAVIQPRGKLPEKLVADGLLQHTEVTMAGRMPVTIKGYTLTELGRMTYCTNC